MTTLTFDAAQTARIFNNNGYSEELPEGATISFIDAEGDSMEFEARMRQAFRFFQKYDDSRYSSRTKMRMLQAADQAAETREADGVWVNSPKVGLLSVPARYDEDTEVKHGGVLGMVLYHPVNNQVQLAVAPSYRSRHLGAFMLDVLRSYEGEGDLVAWVHRRNVRAQGFLLEQGFTISTMNGAGGICFVAGEHEPEGLEDTVF